MRICRVVRLMVILSSFLSVGCGGSGEPTVIEPTETYQPTEQEKQNQKQFDSMRDQRD